MNKIKILLFYFRDLIAKNYMVSSKALIYDNQLIYFYGMEKILFFIFKLFPFSFIKILLNIFNIQAIYELDTIYNITNIKQHYISPMIYSFLFVKDNTHIKNFTTQIKHYNTSIPLKFIIYENNLECYNNIKIKYLNNNKIISKTLDINIFINSPIYNLFNSVDNK